MIHIPRINGINSNITLKWRFSSSFLTKTTAISFRLGALQSRWSYRLSLKIQISNRNFFGSCFCFCSPGLRNKLCIALNLLFFQKKKKKKRPISSKMWRIQSSFTECYAHVQLCIFRNFTFYRLNMTRTMTYLSRNFKNMWSSPTK